MNGYGIMCFQHFQHFRGWFDGTKMMKMLKMLKTNEFHCKIKIFMIWTNKPCLENAENAENAEFLSTHFVLLTRKFSEMFSAFSAVSAFSAFLTPSDQASGTKSNIEIFLALGNAENAENAEKAENAENAENFGTPTFQNIQEH